MAIIILVLFLIGAGYWVYVSFRWYLDMPGLAKHVTESLYAGFLAPIEKRVYTEKGSRTELIFDTNLAQNLILYVTESDRLLKALYDPSSDKKSPAEIQAWELVHKNDSRKRTLKGLGKL